jgi:hypothetical protein
MSKYLFSGRSVADPKFVPQEFPRDPNIIHTHSILSHRNTRGYVVVTWNGETAQFDPEDARAFAHTILRECDNAETDAFLYGFLKVNVEADARMLAILITEYRKYRAKLEQNAGLRPTGQPVPEEDRR